MAVILVLALAFWLWFSHLVAKAAQAKGRAYGAFWVMSFCISPVIAYIIVASMAPVAPKLETLASDRRFAKLGNDTLVKCPQCAEFVKADAQICRFCRSDIGSFVAEVRAQKAAEEHAEALRQLDEEDRRRAAELAEHNRLIAERQAEVARKAAWRKKYLWTRTNAAVVVVATLLAIAVPSYLVYAKNQADITWSKTTGAEWVRVAKSCGNISIDLDKKSVTGDFGQALCLQFKLLGSFTGAKTVMWDPAWKTTKQTNSETRVGRVQVAIYRAVSRCSANNSQDTWINVRFFSGSVIVNNASVASCAFRRMHFGKSLSAFNKTSQAQHGRKFRINGERVSVFSYDPRFFYVEF
jgi:hypothetical protein